MFLYWTLTGVLSSAGAFEPNSSLIWHWFGHHVILTILMLIFLA